MTIDEAKKVLEEQGYLVELFGLGKKKEKEEPAEPGRAHLHRQNGRREPGGRDKSEY